VLFLFRPNLNKIFFQTNILLKFFKKIFAETQKRTYKRTCYIFLRRIQRSFKDSFLMFKTLQNNCLKAGCKQSALKIRFQDKPLAENEYFSEMDLFS